MSNAINRHVFFKCVKSHFSHRNVQILYENDARLPLEDIFYEKPGTYSFIYFLFVLHFLELFIKLKGICLPLDFNKYGIEIAETIVRCSMESIALLDFRGHIQPSALNVLPLFTLISYVNQLNRCLSSGFDDSLMKRLTQVFKDSQACMSISSFDNKRADTVTKWFWWIVKNQVSIFH